LAMLQLDGAWADTTAGTADLVAFEVPRG
jgi:hypothetical protein